MKTLYTFTNEQKDLLIGILEHIKEDLSIQEFMEFGEDINIIIQELTDNSVITG
jgi:hypothetical protein